MQKTASCVRLAINVLIQHLLSHVLQGFTPTLAGYNVYLAKGDLDVKKGQPLIAHLKMCAQKVAGVMAELFSRAHQERITVLMGPNLRKPARPVPWVTTVKTAAQSVLTHLFVQQAITAPLEQNSLINSLVLLAHTTQM